MEVKGNKQKVKSRSDINGPADLSFDLGGNRLAIPANIKEELDRKGFAYRFVSVKVIQENGGYHPKGWVPYEIENPKTNPLTGQAEKVHRIGDLVLAVKTASDAEKHKAYLKQRADMMKKSNSRTVQDMRDRIRDSGASKHVSLFEGYDENGDDE